jgi:Cu/Ag efflux pump CusA
LIEATLLVVVLLLLFLGDVRASVIVALALPMAVLLTFIAMRAVGLTANLMSLGGLAIAVGMLVDGAVVVVENVVERLNDPRHASSSPAQCFSLRQKWQRPWPAALPLSRWCSCLSSRLKGWRVNCLPRWR